MTLSWCRRDAGEGWPSMSRCGGEGEVLLEVFR